MALAHWLDTDKAVLAFFFVVLITVTALLIWENNRGNKP